MPDSIGPAMPSAPLSRASSTASSHAAHSTHASHQQLPGTPISRAEVPPGRTESSPQPAAPQAGSTRENLNARQRRMQRHTVGDGNAAAASDNAAPLVMQQMDVHMSYAAMQVTQTALGNLENAAQGFTAMTQKAGDDLMSTVESMGTRC